MVPVRSCPSVLHLDLDAFYAAVEQRDKPSLRGRPVVVGGTGPRGVVATASYEARAFGVFSAMSTAQARSLCPRAAVLAPRFAAYRPASDAVMALLRALSPRVEPLSLDEAYVDLAAGPHADLSTAGVEALARRLKDDVLAATGLVASVGAGTSKLVAKIASDLDKPDGLRVVPPGTELDLLAPLPASRLWGVGPRTAARLRAAGVTTVQDLRRMSRDDAVGLLGPALGGSVWHLAHGRDDRAVEPEREAKSVSAEDTLERDVADPRRLRALLDILATRVAARLRGDGLSGRTVTVKVRGHDFVTSSRAATLPGPTDDVRVVARTARRLLDELDTSAGVRLLGVGVTGLSDWTQDDLFDDADPVPAAAPGPEPRRGWRPGEDVVHAEHGRGWVQGSGAGRVTVRFETRSVPGRVRTLPAGDPDLAPAGPEPWTGPEHRPAGPTLKG